MNTNTVATDLILTQPRTEISPGPQRFPLNLHIPAFMPQVSRYSRGVPRLIFYGSRLLSHVRSLAFLALVLLPFSAALAVPVLGPWTPIFKGIAHAVGTNDPSVAGNFPELQVVHCVRVDLTNPDVQFFTTPRASGYVAESRETLTLSVPDFLKQYKLQVAADANFYNANPGGADPTSEGVPCEVYGLRSPPGWWFPRRHLPTTLATLALLPYCSRRTNSPCLFSGIFRREPTRPASTLPSPVTTPLCQMA